MVKFFKVLLGIVLALIIIVLVGGFIFIKTFDLNKYKPYVTELAMKETGREVTIGNASLGISLSPTLVLNDVTMANAPWAAEPKMVKVGELEVKLSVLPLLKKQIVIDKVALLNTEIFLTEAADGKQNWVLELPAKDKPSAETATVAETQPVSADKETKKVNSGAAALAGFAAKDVVIENAVVKYNNQKNKQNMDVTVNKITLNAESMDSNINMTFDVVYNQQKIAGEVSSGSVNSLLKGEGDFPVKAAVQAYGVDLKVDGALQNVLKNLGFGMNVNLYNPAGNFGAPETTLIAKVSGNLKEVTADISSLNVVNNVITGRIKADIANKVPMIWADLKSDKINLMNFSKNSNMAWQMPELIASAQASDLVPDKAIPFAVLKSVNADVKLNVAQLIIDQAMQADNVSLTAKLQNGLLNVQPLTLNFGGGEIDASLSANASNDNIAVKLTSKNMKLQNLHQDFVVKNAKSFGIVSGGNLDLDINLSGSGKTYRQLVNNLNGKVIAIAGESVIQTGKLDFLTGNFITQLLNTLNLSSDKVRNIDMTCAVVRADVGGGKAVFPKGIALNAKQLNLVSDGSINLVNDKIDFGIRPFSGKVVDTNLVQALSSFIKVKGTLSDPKIALDDAQAVQALIGVAATGGTAYLGSKLVMDADSSPCYTALAGTPYQSRFPAPSKASQATQDLYQGTQKAIDDSVKDIKGAAKDILGILSGKKK